MQKDVTDNMTTEERQRLNQRLADWFNGVTSCNEADCECGGAWNVWEV